MNPTGGVFEHVLFPRVLLPSIFCSGIFLYMGFQAGFASEWALLPHRFCFQAGFASERALLQIGAAKKPKHMSKAHNRRSTGFEREGSAKGSPRLDT